jgi:hypothetical protein
MTISRPLTRQQMRSDRSTWVDRVNLKQSRSNRELSVVCCRDILGFSIGRPLRQMNAGEEREWPVFPQSKPDRLVSPSLGLREVGEWYHASVRDAEPPLPPWKLRLPDIRGAGSLRDRGSVPLGFRFKRTYGGVGTPSAPSPIPGGPLCSAQLAPDSRRRCRFAGVGCTSREDGMTAAGLPRSASASTRECEGQAIAFPPKFLLCSQHQRVPPMHGGLRWRPLR